MQTTALALENVTLCDEAPATSCSEEVALIREPPAKAHSVWKVAVVATVTVLIAAAATSWARNKTLDDEVTGFVVDAGFATYPSMGCSNWKSIEAKRTITSDKANCESLCKDDGLCTAYNFQEAACETGWLKNNGCLIFHGACEIEKSDCWSLNFNLAISTSTLTQDLGFQVDGPTRPLETAVASALSESGISPVTTAVLGEGKAITISYVYMETGDIPVSAYHVAFGLASNANAQAEFVATVKTKLKAGTTLTSDMLDASQPKMMTPAGLYPSVTPLSTTPELAVTTIA